MKTTLLILLGFGLLMASCEKTNDNPDDFSITGKSFDQKILGKWTRNYSTRDANNGITLWTDTLIFENDNLGNQKLYQFSELTEKIPFQFYSEKDTLVLRIEKDLRKWCYSIKNDSLILTAPLPLYSSYVVVRTYLKDK
jgi:hypothetical protein